MNLKESEKDEIKNLVKRVTIKYIKDLRNVIDNIDFTDDVEDLMANELNEKYSNFNMLAQYLLGVDMTLTPRDLFWILDTFYRDYLWGWLQTLPPDLLAKIDRHFDAYFG